MINYTLMFKQNHDNPDNIDAYNDYQERVGSIRKSKTSKKEWDAIIFTKGNLSRTFSSQEQARRFIENNYL